MKLKAAVELGTDCGLETVEECVNNVGIHAMNLFVYDEIAKEIEELQKEFDQYKITKVVPE